MNTERFDVEGLSKPVTGRVVLDSKEWLTTKEAAEYLSVSLQTAYAWARRGAIPTRRVVGKYYFSTVKLRDFINNEEGNE